MALVYSCVQVHAPLYIAIIYKWQKLNYNCSVGMGAAKSNETR